MDKNLPTRAAAITMDNWQEQLNTMACQLAQDALVDLGPEKAVEIAFAALQTYFLLISSAQLPFLEADATLQPRIDTLRSILASCAVEFDTSILMQERHV